mgnify:CR=1 FL=1
MPQHPAEAPAQSPVQQVAEAHALRCAHVLAEAATQAEAAEVAVVANGGMPSQVCPDRAPDGRLAVVMEMACAAELMVGRV